MTETKTATFTIETVHDRRTGIVTMTLAGELLGTAIDELVHETDALVGAPGLILDMTRVPYLSLAAMKFLMRLVRQVQGAGGDLKLVGVNPYTLNLMELTGTLPLFNRHETVAAARAELEASAT